jgi:calcium-dependent protein kinase
MESEELKYMQMKYNELKSFNYKLSSNLHDFGIDIKIAYHIGYNIEGTSRSNMAQFHSCIYRELGLKRLVKSYYIADAVFSNSVLGFISHPLLTFDLILNEIKALNELVHPKIIRLFDVYFDEKYVHLVTEYCKGRELYDLIYLEQLNSDRGLDIFIQILEGIKYMHSKGYCHRGLCIENIMFLDTNKTKVKIIGFCGAIKFDSPIKSKYGSPMYMAPEVFMENYNELCDEWSAGVILFTILAGHQPFQSNYYNDLLKKVINIRFNKSEKWEKIPKPIKKCIKKILVTKNRPSAQKILEFPVIKKFIKNNNRQAIKQLMRTVHSLKPKTQHSSKIKLSNKLKIAVYKILAPLNLIDNLSSIERIWSELDINNNNILLEKDVASNVENMIDDNETIEHKVHQIIKRFDIDKKGSITRDEFVGLMCEITDKTILNQAFCILDFDSNGIITPLDFDRYFKCQNYENLDKLFEEAVGEDFLNYEDFYLLLTKFI